MVVVVVVVEQVGEVGEVGVAVAVAVEAAGRRRVEARERNMYCKSGPHRSSNSALAAAV